MMSMIRPLIFIFLFFFGKGILFSQINSAQEALKMFSSVPKEDSNSVRKALEEWQEKSPEDFRAYLFLSDYNLLQNILLLQRGKEYSTPKEEKIFENRAAMVKAYLGEAKRLAPEYLDVQLCRLYAAYFMLDESEYQAILKEIIAYNRSNNFNWKVDNTYALPIDYHSILDSIGFKNTAENKFSYWFFIWGKNNLKVHNFIPLHGTHSLLHFTAETLLKEYPQSLHIHLLAFNLYQNIGQVKEGLEILTKVLELYPQDMSLKLIYAAEAYNTTIPYEVAFPFRRRAVEELNKLLNTSQDEDIKSHAKELKQLLTLEEE